MKSITLLWEAQNLPKSFWRGMVKCGLNSCFICENQFSIDLDIANIQQMLLTLTMASSRSTSVHLLTKIKFASTRRYLVCWLIKTHKQIGQEKHSENSHNQVAISITFRGYFRRLIKIIRYTVPHIHRITLHGIGGTIFRNQNQNHPRTDHDATATECGKQIIYRIETMERENILGHEVKDFRLNNSINRLLSKKVTLLYFTESWIWWEYSSLLRTLNVPFSALFWVALLHPWFINSFVPHKGWQIQFRFGLPNSRVRTISTCLLIHLSTHQRFTN